MKFHIRFLANKDIDQFNAFLQEHIYTSMFMRSNAQRAGLEYIESKYFSAHYLGAFSKNKLEGILAFNWNGNIFCQAPDKNVLLELFEFATREVLPQFPIKGILGPDEQSRLLLAWLDPMPNNLALSCTEITYILDLDKIIIPPQLAEGSWTCRLATEKDLEILIPWNIHYAAEALGVEVDKPKAIKDSEEEIQKKIALKEIFVLEAQEKIVAKADYNATLPDIYQIGGVWTPPNLRGRGYARGAVAGALLAAKTQGVRTGLLFTKNPAAVRVYESIGFKEVDQYHMSLFKQPVYQNKI